MKTIIVILLSISSVSFAKETCENHTSTSTYDVKYVVDSQIPKYLEGATITVTLADGKTSTVPAEKFMVVPRKQTTVAGRNQLVERKITCSKDAPNEKKNILIGEIRKDVTNVESDTTAITNGQQVTTHANKELVPGINYYRRGLLDTPVGAGVGVDTNGTFKGLIGVDF